MIMFLGDVSRDTSPIIRQGVQNKTEIFAQRARVDQAIASATESKLNILEDLTSEKSYHSVLAFLRD